MLQDEWLASDTNQAASEQLVHLVEEGIQLAVLGDQVLELQSKQAAADCAKRNMKAAVQAMAAAKRVQIQKVRGVLHCVTLLTKRGNHCMPLALILVILGDSERQDAYPQACSSS
jgi:hypothetical protein